MLEITKLAIELIYNSELFVVSFILIILIESKAVRNITKLCGLLFCRDPVITPPILLNDMIIIGTYVWYNE